MYVYKYQLSNTQSFNFSHFFILWEQRGQKYPHYGLIKNGLLSTDLYGEP